MRMIYKGEDITEWGGTPIQIPILNGLEYNVNFMTIPISRDGEIHYKPVVKVYDIDTQRYLGCLHHRENEWTLPKEPKIYKQAERE